MRLFPGLAFGALLPLWLLTSSVQGQSARYVSTTGTNINFATATSWATSTTDLQGAINSLAATGGTVYVAAGVYYPGGPSNTDLSIYFSMANSVTIVGGYAGSGSPGASIPGSSTLSGEIGDPASMDDNIYNIIFNPTGLTPSAVLDGFVITGGNAAFGPGGGAYNNGSGTGNVCNPSFRNCSFMGNRATYSGGAMFNYGQGGGQSSPVLINCSFQNNSASQGGAISNYGDQGQSSPILINCSFQGNSASQGGAMYSYVYGNGQSSPVLTNCVVFGNGAENTFSLDNTPSFTATYCLFENTATGYITDPTNLTTATSPFASPSSVALAFCSPAINVGNNAAYTAANGPATDVVGNPRLVGSSIDMGAVEFQGIPPGAVLSLQADESACPVRLLGQGVGTSFVFTNSQGYVFSNVYRAGGTHSVFAEGIKQPGVYTLTATYNAECGSGAPVSQSVTVSKSCP